MPGFLQRVNLVSLILGQLVIRSHKRLRRELRLKWPGKYTSWPFLCQLSKRLHLQVEFKLLNKAVFICKQNLPKKCALCNSRPTIDLTLAR